MLVCGQRDPLTALHPGKRTGTECIGGWVGQRTVLYGYGNSHLSPGFDPRTVQPVAKLISSLSVYAFLFIKK